MSDSTGVDLARILGVSGRISDKVLQAATEDPLYAHHLVASRHTPEFLEVLLKNPPSPLTGDEGPRLHSSAELTRKAATALFKWAATGFRTVDQGVYKNRLSACDTCPNLTAPSQALPYRLLWPFNREGDRRICRICGCFVSQKARLSSEVCPDANPARPSVSRWGEPLQP